MNDSKTSRRPRSRLICRVVRGWESARGPAEGQTWIAERHMETCDACQEFFAEDTAFEEGLRRGALSLKSEVLDAGFDFRIMQAVRESLPEREPRHVRARSWGFSLAAVAAGVALALVITQRNDVPQKSAPTLAVVDQPPAPSQTLTKAASWLSSVDARGSALELVERNPLQQEIDSISTDAQSVLGFLALNFLPTDVAAIKQPSSGSRVNDAGQG
jgi:hypothetical protein